MRLFYFTMILLTSVFIISCSESESSDSCSKDNLTGSCDGDNVCVDGSCQVKPEDCSVDYPNGYCEGDNTCKTGICTSNKLCSSDNLNGTCEDESKFCDEGNCVDRLSQYKIGVITQTIDIEAKPNVLLDEYHYEIMDITGRNKRRITNDIESCINKDSCWASTNYKYFLYLKDVGNGVYSLNIVDIPDDFNTNFAQSTTITSKLVGEPFFLNDGISFIYVENISTTPNSSQLMLKKYNMSTKTSSDIRKFSMEKVNQDGVSYDAPASHFVVSKDNTTLVFDIDVAYQPVEVYAIDLNNPSAEPSLFYKYSKVDRSGRGLEWATISSDNKVLAFVSSFDIMYRLHFAYLDKSSLVDDGGDPENAPLGKYIGPLENACSDIQGVQICQMKSELVYSKDNKFLYFAGRVDGGTEISRPINIYKFDIANDILIKITSEDIEGHNIKDPEDDGYVRTSFQDLPFQSITFNMDTNNAVYTMAQQGAIKNYDVHYLNLNSVEKEMDSKLVVNSREGRELRTFFLRK